MRIDGLGRCTIHAIHEWIDRKGESDCVLRCICDDILVNSHSLLVVSFHLSRKDCNIRPPDICCMRCLLQNTSSTFTRMIFIAALETSDGSQVIVTSFMVHWHSVVRLSCSNPLRCIRIICASTKMLSTASSKPHRCHPMT